MPNESDSSLPERPTSGPGTTPAGDVGPVTRTDARPVPARGAGRNGRPTDPAEMRQEIERTRARMSSTLDAIEARIVYERESLERKKDELVDQVTLRPLREKLAQEPWRTMALAFVAGYVIAAIRD